MDKLGIKAYNCLCYLFYIILIPPILYVVYTPFQIIGVGICTGYK